MENGRQFHVGLYRGAAGQVVTLDVLRGTEALRFPVALGERRDLIADLASAIDPRENLVPRLGILGVTVNPAIAQMLPGLRMKAGVVVASLANGTLDSRQGGLAAGDVVFGVNRTPVPGLDDLRAVDRYLETRRSGGAARGTAGRASLPAVHASNDDSTRLKHNGAVAPRVRFAPSPTGYLHVGGARTALFNWLYARRHGGTFVLRIEDTDVERSSADMVTGILDGLRWLGLDWDEGPGRRRTARSVFPVRAARSLPGRGRAARRRGLRLLLLLLAGTAARRAREGRTARRGVAVRPRMPGAGARERSPSSRPLARRARSASRSQARRTAFDDAVHGRIEFDPKHIEDFVVLRSDQHPTYHLSVVVDDVDMAITHVIRGDDHISNTPKHLMLFDAFGVPPPVFAHVPLILGADKKRLSKRHGATSVTEYRRQGYLPERDGELPRAAGVVAGRRPRADVDHRADRELLARGDQRRQRRVQHREARLDERAVHRAAADRGAAAGGRAVSRRRGPARSGCPAGGCRGSIG